MRNSYADKSWYWPAGQYCYYQHLAPVAIQRWINPMPAHDGRPLNPSAHPFKPKEVIPKPSCTDKVIPSLLPQQLTPTSKLYITPLPVYHPLLHPPSVVSYWPPQPPTTMPLVQSAREIATLRGSGGKSVSLGRRTKRQRAMWKPKLGCSNSSTVPTTHLANGGGDDDFEKCTQPSTPDQIIDDDADTRVIHGSTTLMIKNIPNSLKYVLLSLFLNFGKT